MARKNILSPIYINSINSSVNSLSQSLASDFVTVPIGIPYLDNVGIQIVISTSDSVGTFSILASLDGSNYSTLTLSGQPFANAGNDDIVVSLTMLPYKYLQVSYTHQTAGTGTCTIQIIAKQIGG